MIAVGSAGYAAYGGPAYAAYGGPAYAAGPLIIDNPTPYAFGFDVTDEYGTTLTRQEAGDGSGAVKGSYSYKDDKGLLRIVDYVADGYGFRANVKTNEPGTETSAPADVTINANPVYAAPKLIARPALALKPRFY